MKKSDSFYENVTGLFWYPVEKKIWDATESGEKENGLFCKNSPSVSMKTKTTIESYTFYKHLSEAHCHCCMVAGKSPVVYVLLRLDHVPLVKLPRREPDNVIDPFSPLQYVSNRDIPAEKVKILEVAELDEEQSYLSNLFRK